ncbi:MAG TPA: PDZ domain-containing protein, partial [Planctomycetota bacterium]
GLHPEFPFELSEIEHLPSFVGSDNDSFTRVGVPGLFWRQSGRSDYEHHHHTQHDSFDAIVPEYQEHSALVTALAALGVADLPALLDRTDMKAPEPRRLGVQLDGTRITELSEDSRAAAAGMRVGDVLLTIDGRELRNRGSVSEATREGGTVKTIQVKRGEETLTFTLDWSDDPDEPRRLQELEKRAAEEAGRRAEREAERAGAAPAPR